jgi:hypothetical protein
MRIRLALVLAAATTLLAGCNDGQLIDASGEASGGTQAGGGALAFIFMVITIVAIALLLFALDRMRKRRLEADDTAQAAANEQQAKSATK